MRVSGEVDVSEYCRVKIAEGSNIFLFVFSGANLPAGKFNYYNSLKSCTYNVIFLNDRLDRYYQEGIIGIGDLDETILYFRKIIEAVPAPQVFSFGCSMGGYGALLYGALLGCQSTLTFSPAIPRYCSVLWQTPYYHDVSLDYKFYLERILSSRAHNIVYFGDRGVGDLCSYSCLRGISGDVKVFQNACHALIYPLVQFMDLEVIVDKFVSGGLCLDSIGLLRPYKSFGFLKRLFVIGDAYFDRRLLGNEFELNADEQGISAINAAFVEMYISTDLERSKNLFFDLLEQCINTRSLKLIYEHLSSADIERLYLVIINEVSSNPALLGYDGNEKTFIGDSLIRAFHSCKRRGASRSRLEGVFEGYFDKFDGRNLYGWASGQSSSRETVTVSLNGDQLSSVVCDQYRSDLKRKNKGFGGNCAFKFPLALSKLSSSGPNRIQVVSNTYGELCHSNSYVCNSMFIGVLDSVKGHIMKGWLVNHIYKDIPVDICVYVNGRRVGEATLDRPRKDLQKKGYLLNSGFLIDLSLYGLSDGRNSIDIYAYDNVRVFQNIEVYF